MLSNEDFVGSPLPTPFINMYQHLIDNDPDAYYPWTNNLDEIAAEEEAIPIPCGFTTALYAMTATADDDYFALLDTHVTIMEFMRTEGIKVFTNMHMNWEGIQGIELFELNWKETTPPVLRPTCRPIKKAINRLRGYLLFPSDSPVYSNIVLASKATPPSTNSSVETTFASTNSSAKVTILYPSFEASSTASKTTVYTPILTSRTPFTKSV